MPVTMPETPQLIPHLRTRASVSAMLCAIVILALPGSAHALTTSTAAVTTTPTSAPSTTTPATTGTTVAPTTTHTGHASKISTPAIALAVVAALLALACATWAAIRLTAFEPRWLSSARHALAEGGFRMSATWAEFTDWARLGK